MPTPLHRPGSLTAALRASTRTLFWGVCDDPVAQDVLSTTGLATLDQVLATHGLGPDQVPLTPLSGGVGSVVLAAGDRVVRLGLGPSVARAPIPEMLQPLARGQVAGVRYEILPRVITEGITPAMVSDLEVAIAARGYAWTDVGDDNVGLLPGARPTDPPRALVLDPGGVDPLPGTVPAPSRAVSLVEEDRRDVAAWLNIAPEQMDLHQGWLSSALLDRQVVQAQASYLTFPREAARTRRIVRALTRGEPLRPVFVNRGDPSLFVMEGRHRMVAFVAMGLAEIPVVYVAPRSPRQDLDEAWSTPSASQALSPSTGVTPSRPPRRSR